VVRSPARSKTGFNRADAVSPKTQRNDTLASGERQLIYLKSLLAALGALIAFYFLFVTVGIRLLLPVPPDLPEGAGYVSNSPWLPLWPILVIALLVFSGVYFWTFRKLSKPRQR
jgi:hypothetical protein